jgi:DNA-directed RNA polymerase specialized sigma24 family protein
LTSWHGISLQRLETLAKSEGLLDETKLRWNDTPNFLHSLVYEAPERLQERKRIARETRSRILEVQHSMESRSAEQESRKLEEISSPEPITQVQNEGATSLDEVLSAMPERLLRVLDATEGESTNIPKAAKKLGITENTARVYLSQALSYLAERLDGKEAEIAGI